MSRYAVSDSAARPARSMPSMVIGACTGAGAGGSPKSNPKSTARSAGISSAAGCWACAGSSASKLKSVSTASPGDCGAPRTSSTAGTCGGRSGKSANANVAGNSTISTLSSGSAGCAAAGLAVGNSSGTKRCSVRMASAASRNWLAFQPLSVPAAMSSTHSAKPRMASAASLRRSSLAGFCSASQALNTCSMDQPASPNSFSPTIRELPLSV